VAGRLFRKIADILFLWAEPIIFEIDLLLERIREERRISGVHVVAVASGEVIGWCDIVPQPFEGMQHVGSLGVGVHKDHRSRGVGAAVRLYEAFGFEYEGHKVAARKIDGVKDDILLYAKRKAG